MSYLGRLYEGQLDAVLDAYKAIEAYEDADALMRLRYTSPIRATAHLDHMAADPPTDEAHACHGCPRDPKKHTDVEDWHGKAAQPL